MSIGVGLFTATTWGWDVVRIWPWAQYRNPYSGGWEIKSARVLEILWAVGFYHRLPGDSSARAILEHPHLAWPFLFLFPFTDLWLAFCPGTEGLGVFRDFPDSTTPASVRQDSARQYQSPSDGLKTVCAGLWHLRHKLNNNWALCWQHVMTGVVNKLAQGPLSYVAIVSHDHSSTPSHSWGCCVYPAWGCPGWGCPGWEPAPAHLLLHWWHRSSVGPGPLPPAAELPLRSEAMCPGTHPGRQLPQLHPTITITPPSCLPPTSYQSTPWNSSWAWTPENWAETLEKRNYKWCLETQMYQNGHSGKFQNFVGRPHIYVVVYSSFCFFLPWGGAPFLEVLQYQVDAWSGQSKLLILTPSSKNPFNTLSSDRGRIRY